MRDKTKIQEELSRYEKRLKDINYIWMDKYPTLFCLQGFKNISDDHHKSMSEMTEQVREENVTGFGPKRLLRLTEHNIHRTPDIDEGGMRTFVKISLSTQKYNLKGNSHNYLFDYNWEMHDRDKLRNNPYFAETDYVPEQANADLESMFGSQLPENKMKVSVNK